MTDLCILASLPPAGLLCELVNDSPEGSMARRDDCRKFADRYDIFHYFYATGSMPYSIQMGNQYDKHRTNHSISSGTPFLRVPFHFGSRRNVRGLLSHTTSIQIIYYITQKPRQGSGSCYLLGNVYEA